MSTSGTTLSWSVVNKLSRAEREAFTCVTDWRKNKYGRQVPQHAWQSDVQRHFRTIKGVQPPEYLLVGRDVRDHIVTLVNFAVFPDDGACKILALATSTAHRNCGYGREGIRTLVRLLQQGRFGSIRRVFGLIDSRNEASKAANAAAGLRHRGFFLGYEVWDRDI